MSHKRELSPAEEQGWRRYWDGWVICHECKEAELASRRLFYNRPDILEWAVPVDYDTPIGEAHEEYDSGCVECGKKPPLFLTWKTQRAA